RIDGDASREQKADEQAVVGFYNAREIFRRRGNTQQKLFQLVQTVVAVSEASRSNALARFIQDFYIMVRVSPIQSNVPHLFGLLSGQTPGCVGSLYNGCSKQRPSNRRLAQEDCQGKNDLLVTVEPCGESSLSPADVLNRFTPALAQDLVGLAKS